MLCLDVGGTEIKVARMDARGGMTGPVRRFPAGADGTADAILTGFTRIIEEMEGTDPISAVHFAFPGPFDYENGVCLMRGLDKYDSLYGVNLRQALSARLGILPDSIRFCNDVAAFALGELQFGAAAGAARGLFLCIGTGCGSAFSINGQLAPEGTAGVPPHGYVYPLPFRDGCIDDYISKRGLMHLAQTWLGAPLEGRELADLANAGSEAAASCFLQFGQNLCEAVTPVLEAFRPQCLCIGGQISKSACWFFGPLEAQCRRMHIHGYVTEDTSLRTFQGLTRIPTEPISQKGTIV